MSLTLTLPFSFVAAHLYKNENWDETKNKATFGKCFTEFGHGHNYRGKFQIQYSDLQKAKEKFPADKMEIEKFLSSVDHSHLNFTFEVFKNQVPTTERISLWLKETLTQKNISIQQVDLYEMDDLFVELT